MVMKCFKIITFNLMRILSVEDHSLYYKKFISYTFYLLYYKYKVKRKAKDNHS